MHRKIKKQIGILRKFTFWLSALSILICLSDYLGIGVANIVLSQFNPVTHVLIITEPFRNWMIDVESTKRLESSVLVSFRFPTYLIHFGTFLVVGLFLDYLISHIANGSLNTKWKKYKKKVNEGITALIKRREIWKSNV